MAVPYLNNNYLQDIGQFGMSSPASTNLNFSANPGSNIPVGQFGGAMDQADSWMKNLDGSGKGMSDSLRGFGLNIPTAQLALGGLSSLGNIWGAMQAQKLARDNFNFTRDVTNTNLNNSIQSYNTALTDKLTSRAKAQGQSDADRDAQIAANRLNRS